MKLRSILFLSLTLIAASLFAQDAQQQPYSIDKAHSSAMFSIRHLMTNVPGRFRDVEGAINIVPDNPGASSVEFTIQAASVDTANENRDKHLKSPDFFDVEKFPTITFKSTAIAKTATKDLYNVTGDLTMHGVTKRVTLPVSLLGMGKSPRGIPMAGFAVDTTLNRKDYGIVWNRALDQGGTLLGDDVHVTINIEAAQRPPAPPAAPAAPAAPTSTH